MTRFSRRRAHALILQSCAAAACGLALSAQSVRLSTSREQTMGDVLSLTSSADGQWVVYLADQDTDGVYELYSARSDGSASPVKLNAPLPPGDNVSTTSGTYKIAPLGERVVYGVSPSTGVLALYSVPLAGGASTQLTGTHSVDIGAVEPFRISPDGTRVVYSSDYRLYSVAIGGGPSVQLSQTMQLDLGHSVFSYGSYAIAADSSRVVFSSDEGAQGILRLHARPIDGGALANLSPSADTYLGPWAIHPDGARVLFVSRRPGEQERLCCSAPSASNGNPMTLARHAHFGSLKLDAAGEQLVYLASDVGASQLYALRVPVRRLRPTEAPSETRITPPAAGSRTIVDYRVDLGARRVVYSADQNVAGQLELFSAPLDGGAATRLSVALPSTGDVSAFRLAGDGARVFYSADSDADNVLALFGVPIGGGASTQLSPPLVSGGTLWGFAFNSATDRVAYLAEQDTDDVIEAYSVPADGGPSTRLNTPLYAGQNVLELRLDASGRVFYRSDQDENGALELYTVAATGGASVKLSGALAQAEEDDVASFLLDGSGTSAVYMADENTDGWSELFSAPVDGSAPSTRLGPPPIHLGAVYTVSLAPDGANLLVLAAIAPVSEVFLCAIDGSSPPLRLATPPPARFLAKAAISSTGDRIAYFANAITDPDGDRDLYSAPADGSLSSTRLDDGIENPQLFWIVAGGTRVVYLSSVRLQGYRLMSIPIDGGARVRLSPANPSGFIEDVGFTADGTRVVFRADVDIDGTFELYSAPVDGSTPAVKLNTSLPEGHDVFTYQLTPDGTRALYTAQQESSNLQLYSVALDGSSAPVKLSGTVQLSDRDAFAIAPTGERVVFHSKDGKKVYSAPIDGSSAAVWISPPFVAGGLLYPSSGPCPYAITPDGLHVAYVAAQEQLGVFELFTVPIDGGASVKLSAPLPASREVRIDLQFRADSQRVVYRTAGYAAGLPIAELFESPIDASEPARRLHPDLVPSGEVKSFEVHGNRAFYLADQDSDEVLELYSSELGI